MCSSTYVRQAIALPTSTIPMPLRLEWFGTTQSGIDCQDTGIVHPRAAMPLLIYMDGLLARQTADPSARERFAMHAARTGRPQALPSPRG